MADTGVAGLNRKLDSLILNESQAMDSTSVEAPAAPAAAEDKK
jgi:hypothetical protein